MQPAIPGLGEEEDPLSTLFDIGQALAGQLEPRQALERVVEFLEHDHEAARRCFRVLATIAQAFKASGSMGQGRKRLLADSRNSIARLQQRYDFSSVLGNGGPMRQVREQIALAASTDGTVLIQGEPGTGKERIARAIHCNSPRARRPMVKVTLAAVPEAAVEAVLFGREERTPGEAQAARRGRFELAEGGTLFLDEVGRLSGAMQVKLLRALQERVFERAGGAGTVQVDVRLIAATSRNLEASVASGSFRQDLYYRLNVVPIFLPPLRDRRSDIRLLVDHFIALHSQQRRKGIRRISAPALDLLLGHHWPGNVRELEDTIEHAVLACDGGAIHAHHLPPSLQTAETAGTAQTPLAGAVERYEKDLILDAMKSARGNIAAVARLLSTTERIVGYKIRKYRIDPRRFRPRRAPGERGPAVREEEP